MSSVVRAHDQLDRRVQYFYVISDLTRNTNGTNGNVVNIPSTRTVSTVMSQSAFNSAIDATSWTTVPTANTILRDMGKQITINDGLLDIAVYRRVQIVNGPVSEGAPASFNDLYVLTWVANPSSSNVVRVARTG
jgi:hypothetical protein